MKTVDYTLPDWTLSALINNDYSGLSDEEYNLLSNWIDSKIEQYQCFFAMDNRELGFCSHNDLDRLAGNCSEVTFNIKTI